MNDLCKLYKSQFKKAKETLDILELQKAEIDFKLQSDPVSSALHKELRMINLDIKITVNEIEHAQSNINDFEFQSKTPFIR